MKCTVFAAALALAVTLPAVQAQAQAPRTFVSAAGSDSNPCSFALPCRHFQAAVNATSDGGEVDALDPAGYSPITISRGITIEGQGWSYIAPPANLPAITINAVNGDVYIHGVSLNGGGITGNTTGIQFNSGGSLTVSDSVIRHFGAASGAAGIVYQPGASGTLSVSNTLVSDNFEGIDILPSGTGTTAAVLDHVKMEHNTNYGIQITTSSQSINVTVSDSVVSSNQYGIVVSSPQVKPVNVMVRNSIIANNLAGYGMWAVFDNAIIRVTGSTITGNGSAFFGDSGGTVASYGDNNIAANVNSVTAPPKIGDQ